MIHHQLDYQFINPIFLFFQNVMDTCLGASAWWAIGFAFAFGEVDNEDKNTVIGLHVSLLYFVDS